MYLEKMRTSFFDSCQIIRAPILSPSRSEGANKTQTLL